MKKLDTKETLRLADYLRSLSASESRELTVSQLAMKASAALGFQVTKNNLRKVMKAAGLRLKPERSKRNGDGDILVLCEAVMKLYAANANICPDSNFLTLLETLRRNA